MHNNLFLFTDTGDANPSSNSYTLPSMLGHNVVGKGSAPAYTVRPKATTGGFDEDLAKTPGPGKYNDVKSEVYNNKAPVYSMLGRNYYNSGKK